MDSSSDLQRKLRESQERQALILKKIAEKEKRLDLGNSFTSANSAATSQANSAATAPPRQQGSPKASPGLHSSLFSSHSAQPFAADSPFLSRAAQGIDISVVNPSDDAAASARYKELLTQLRHAKQDQARKDIALTNNAAQLAELQAIVKEYAQARQSWDERERQHALREQETTQALQDAQSAIQGFSALEQQLRAQNASLAKDKLSFERSATLQLGDLDAQLHSLRAELDAKGAQLTQAQYESSLAQREGERVAQAYRAFESTQLQIANAMEEKFFALKREHQVLEGEHAALTKEYERLKAESLEREDRLESQETALDIHTRTKASQNALVDSLTRELSELQAERAVLRSQVDSIPALKADLAALEQARNQAREARGELLKEQTARQTVEGERDSLSSTVRDLKALILELERSQSESRRAFDTLTGPGGELQAARDRAQAAEGEVQKLMAHGLSLHNELTETIAELVRTKEDQVREREWLGKQLEDNKDLLAGERAHKEVDPPEVLPEFLRSAAATLRHQCSTARRSMDHLAEIEGSNASLRAQLAQVEADLASVEAEREQNAAQWERERDTLARSLAGEQAHITRLQSELDQQRHDNTLLNQQNEALLTELDDRAITVRLWGVEVDALARALAPSSDQRSGISQGLEERPSLGASASTQVAEHWPSVRAVFGDLLALLTSRCRMVAAELVDSERDRSQQRQDLARVSEELEQTAEQLRRVADDSHQTSRAAAQALAESESLRLSDAQRMSDQSNQRCEELQQSYEKIVAQIQETNRQNTAEIIDLTRTQQNLVTACRLFYKGSANEKGKGGGRVLC